MNTATIITVLVFSAGIGSSSTTRVGQPRQGSVVRILAVNVQGLDSAGVVSLARKALQRTDDSLPLDVRSFQRKPEGYLIELVPSPPSDPRVDVIGGGGLVLVQPNGRAKVIRYYR